MNAQRQAILLGAVLLSLAAPPGAGATHTPAQPEAKVFTIRAGEFIVNRIGAFRPRRNPTIGAAIRAFGRPSSRRLRREYWCVVKWRRLRLRIDFLNFGGHGPGETTCTATVGKAQSFVVKGRRFRTWKGLRVGDRESQIEALHPSAELRRREWWLRTAFSPIGEGGEYAVVKASVGPRGRVSALSGWIGAAGE